MGDGTNRGTERQEKSCPRAGEGERVWLIPQNGIF